MADNNIAQQRWEARATQDFEPAGLKHGQVVPDEGRQAHALEYIAFQLGQINHKLDRLTAAIEALAGKTS